MFVKICGISNAIDAEYVNVSNADAIGFVMGGDVFPVEIEPSAQAVRKIIGTLRTSLLSVLVTHLKDHRDILDLAKYLRCGAIQISEPLCKEEVIQVRERSSGIIIIKTVPVLENFAENYLKEMEDCCDYILLDTQRAGYIGGTGETNDWKLCSKLIQMSSKPVLLAGGLSQFNICEAISLTNPAGVDVSTGVSVFSDAYPRKDRKDPAKIQTFIKKAKGAL